MALSSSLEAAAIFILLGMMIIISLYNNMVLVQNEQQVIQLGTRIQNETAVNNQLLNHQQSQISIINNTVNEINEHIKDQGFVVSDTNEKVSDLHFWWNHWNNDLVALNKTK